MKEIGPVMSLERKTRNSRMLGSVERFVVHLTSRDAIIGGYFVKAGTECKQNSRLILKAKENDSQLQLQTDAQ